MSNETLKEYRSSLARMYKWTDSEIESLPFYKAKAYFMDGFKYEQDHPSVCPLVGNSQ